MRANDAAALENRRRFDAAGVTVVNLMAAPGAGKTSLVLRTIAALHPLPVGVVEGDVAWRVDADRVAEIGAPVVQMKYPALFAQAAAVVVDKIDLAPYQEFDRQAFRRLVIGLNPRAAFFELSCRTGEGIPAWAAWLRQKSEGL